jgi:myb proto-oncogene protein
LFNTYKNFGNKWAKIAKFLNGRTDNDIKNHFFSTLRRSLRRISKKINDKSSTKRVKELKPIVLTKFFEWFMNPNKKGKKRAENPPEVLKL